MSDQPTTIQGSVGGDVSGQVAIGQDIRQSSVSAGPALSSAERDEVHQLFAALRVQMAAAVPPEAQAGATERLEELEEALLADEPDLTTVQYVRRWFARHLPRLAGMVTGVLVHPLVGRLVQAAGESIADAAGPSV
ncbi:MAG: hypothetical protein ACR2HV_02170 [Acidimicrobiales bacterium]